MSNHLPARTALYAGRDLVIGLALFAIIAVGLGADFDHVWPADHSDLSLRSATSHQIMASAHAQATVISHKSFIATSLIKNESSDLSVVPASYSARAHQFTATSQQLAMLILALMFATITVVIQRSARHLRTIVTAPRPMRRKRRTRDFKRSNTER